MTHVTMTDLQSLTENQPLDTLPGRTAGHEHFHTTVRGRHTLPPNPRTHTGPVGSRSEIHTTHQTGVRARARWQLNDHTLATGRHHP